MEVGEGEMAMGMLVGCGWGGKNIADPDQAFTLEGFRAGSRKHFSTLVQLDRFVDYGLWYQRQAAPELDQRKIMRVELDEKGFRLIPEKGSTVFARRVVVAAGIGSFAWRPPQFANLPSSLASHTSEHREFQRFAGKRVLAV